MNLAILLVSYVAMCNCAVRPEIEGEFIKEIRDFFEYEKVTLMELKRFRNTIKNIHDHAYQDPEYLENPFNNFLVVKRLAIDWQYIIPFATLYKYQFMKELLQDVSAIQRLHNFPRLNNLRDIVLKIADAQEKQEVNSVSEFLMTLTNDPYTRLTGSDHLVFAEVLKAANRSTLAKFWKHESRVLSVLTKDPLMETPDLSMLTERLYSART